jgi:hypothetical protein
MTGAQRPSPFTIPSPVYVFSGEGSSSAREPRRMTLGGLIRNLIMFADFYEEASDEIERAAPFIKPSQIANRDANSNLLMSEFKATVAIDRIRGYVLSNYGEELTVETARRMLGELMRVSGITLTEAETLGLEAVMDTLERKVDKQPSDMEQLTDDAGKSRGEAVAECSPLGQELSNAISRLINVYTNGTLDTKFTEAAQHIVHESLTANEKLEKLNSLLPIPKSLSARQLGDLLGVTKQAILKTAWWTTNRKGDGDELFSRRQEIHKGRRLEYQDRSSSDFDDEE